VPAGDLAAFETIYRAHSGRLYSVACRVLGNPTDAEDLLQEIFLAAHRKLETSVASRRSARGCIAWP
jgi:RNA polymerase sigma-70 factor (ECF subfamily)